MGKFFFVFFGEKESNCFENERELLRDVMNIHFLMGFKHNRFMCKRERASISFEEVSWEFFHSLNMRKILSPSTNVVVCT